MEFIFMLTREDKTVTDCLEVFDLVKNTGVKHMGFKDVGVDFKTLKKLSRQIREAGVTSYIEVVSTTPETAQASIRMAADIGVDCVLGGNEVAFAQETLNGRGVGYFPFPGRPIGHPTDLGGSPEDIANDCAAMRSNGCPGVDLLAYRAIDADPLDLVRAARGALGDGRLIVAGSVDSPERINALAKAGVDAFTIGSAIFNGAISPNKGSILSQIKDALAACA